jgi:hypothetical protein
MLKRGAESDGFSELTAAVEAKLAKDFYQDFGGEIIERWLHVCMS